MNYLVWVVPLALGMGAIGLTAFLWSIRTGQYEDLDGDAARVLLAAAEDKPLMDPVSPFAGKSPVRRGILAPNERRERAKDSR